MAVADFLKRHIRECKAIGDSLLEKNESFTSHEFIEKFRADFPKEYISWLGYAPEHKDAQFQTVNGLTARFLSEYDAVLGIEKGPRTLSKNDNGNITGTQTWKRIKK